MTQVLSILPERTQQMNNSIDLKLMGDAMSLLVPLVMNNSLFCMNVVISSHANCELLTDDFREDISSDVKLLLT